VRSDNGPQFWSQEFISFAKAYNFDHVTSSPLYPQSNGQVERTVQTLKKLSRQTDDLCQGLLGYWTTPMLCCNLSPSELLMGQKLRSLLPLTDNFLIPQWPYLSEFCKANEARKRSILISVIIQERNLHCRMMVKCGLPQAESQWEEQLWQQQILQEAILLIHLQGQSEGTSNTWNLSQRLITPPCL